MNLLIQLIGVIGVILIVISFQKNKKSFTLISQMFSALLFTIHFFLLGAWTGAGMNIISAIRAYTFNLKEKKKFLNKKILMYIFILIFWIVGFFTWDKLYSILPIISMTLECFALWNDNTKYMRWLFLSARPTWIIYNIIVGSYAGLLSEAFIIMSVGTAVVRFDILKQKEKI